MRAELRLAELSSAKKTVRGDLVGISRLHVPGHVEGSRDPELMEHGEKKPIGTRMCGWKIQRKNHSA